MSLIEFLIALVVLAGLGFTLWGKFKSKDPQETSSSSSTSTTNAAGVTEATATAAAGETTSATITAPASASTAPTTVPTVATTTTTTTTTTTRPTTLPATTFPATTLPPVFCKMDTDKMLPQTLAGRGVDVICTHPHVGNLRATCNSDGTWNVAETCKRKCLEPSGWTLPAGTTYLVEGDTATKGCPQNQTGTVTGVCKADGTIQERAGNTCAAITCDAHPTYNLPATTSGVRVGGKCPTGQTGTVTGLCTSTRAWQVDTAGCSQNRCRAQTLAGTDSRLLESVADGLPHAGTCANGRWGTVEATCNTDGTWTGVKDQCYIRCTKETNPGWFDGSPVTSLAIGDTTPNTSRCPIGYVGTVIGKCQADGTMTAQSIAGCYRKYCPVLATQSYMLPQADTGTDAVSGACASGYKGSVTAKCSVDDGRASGGSWGSVNDGCKKLYTIMSEALTQWTNAKAQVVSAQAAVDAYNAETQRIKSGCGDNIYCLQGASSTRGSGSVGVNNQLSAMKGMETTAKAAYDAAKGEYDRYIAAGGSVVN
jgi:hypothetical protein